MSVYITDQLKKKLNSVQINPMKHCTEYNQSYESKFIGKWSNN